MGDYADDLLDRAIADGSFGFFCHRGRRPNTFSATCKYCGTPDLRWRTNDQGQWRLYEDRRVEHNKLAEHICPQDQPNPEGFE